MSCSEKDDTVNEYGDWQKKNEQYFEAAYLAHDYDFSLRKYSLTEDAATDHTDYVLVDVLGEGSGTASPYLTDSVSVHYVGHLIPSPSYAAGYQFDQSFQAPFDASTAVASRFTVNGVVSGFATALLKMHRGDHWLVTIPYQLGYGISDSGSIPGYSTLIFEIILEDFWTKKKGDRD